jgi:hypothetical protein
MQKILPYSLVSQTLPSPHAACPDGVSSASPTTIGIIGNRNYVYQVFPESWILKRIASPDRLQAMAEKISSFDYYNLNKTHAYFNDSQRQVTKDAGKIAGLDLTLPMVCRAAVIVPTQVIFMHRLVSFALGLVLRVMDGTVIVPMSCSCWA